MDARIVARLLALPEVAAAQTIMAFWPLPGEVDLRPLVAALLARGATVALPAVLPGPVPRLAARVFTSGLVAGRWGLQEPPETALVVDPDEIDIVIVPALAVGRDGSRLGYGGGYYDAFLPATRARRVGVVPAACLAASLPAEAHDARLDAVVTEIETLRFPRNSLPDGP